VVLAPLQTTWLETVLTWAVELTVIVKLRGVPLQVTPPLVYAGVTVIVAVTGEVPVLTAVNEAMSPFPLANNPIEGVLFVQLYTIVPPVAVDPKDTAVVASPLHSTWLDTAFTVAVGLTVIVKLVGGPVQDTPPLVKVGVTVIVAITGDVPVLTAANALILPVPLAATPIVTLSFVQLYVVAPPVLTVPKTIAVVLVPLQATWLFTEFTWAVGLTVIVKVRGVPLHVKPPLVYTGVIVTVAVTGAVPELIAVNEAISPVPLAPKPIVVLLFVQLNTIVPPVAVDPKDTAVVASPVHTT
jgi:hypothetical protein